MTHIKFIEFMTHINFDFQLNICLILKIVFHFLLYNFKNNMIQLDKI